MIRVLASPLCVLAGFALAGNDVAAHLGDPLFDGSDHLAGAGTCEVKSRAAVLSDLGNMLDRRGFGPPAPTSGVWKQAKNLTVYVVRTGRPALDDALAEGFRQKWKVGGWAWLEDSVLAGKTEESFLVFASRRLRSTESISRLASCRTGWKRSGNVCSSSDSASLFMLLLANPKEPGKVLHTEYSEISTRAGSEGMALDLVRDFNDVLERQWSSTKWNTDFYEESADWIERLAEAAPRENCPTCVVYVPREYGIAVAPKRIEELLGRPIRFIGLDSLDDMLGTSVPGYYLEAGGKSQIRRYAKVRTISGGELVASADTRVRGRWDSRLEHPESERVLGRQELELLGHRLHGDEKRMTYSLAGGVMFASKYWWRGGFVGVEAIRSLHLQMGYGTVVPSAESDLEIPSVGELFLGARWIRKLPFESPAMDSRISYDLGYLQPLGNSKVSGDLVYSQPFDNYQVGSDRWKPAPVLLVGATMMIRYFEVGAGFAFLLGDDVVPGSSDLDGADESAMYVRLGLRLELTTWKKGHPSFVK